MHRRTMYVLQLAATLLILTTGGSALAALEPYIKVQGFEGTSVKVGHPKGSTIVYSVAHSVSTPFDPVHGALTGRRQQGVVTVEMSVDASAFQYYQAVVDKDKSGAKKLSVELGFFRANQQNIGLWGGGETAPYYKLNLVDAFVSSVEFVHPNTVSTTGPAGEYLRVSFVYRQIEWTYMNGNKSASDAWDAK